MCQIRIGIVVKEARHGEQLYCDGKCIALDAEYVPGATEPQADNGIEKGKHGLRSALHVGRDLVQSG